WAMIQVDLGFALQRLGDRETRAEHLEQAIDAFRLALQEITRAGVPLYWATTQMDLGPALMSLGKRQSGTEQLEQAVEALRPALQENTRERVPIEWAKTEFDLGLALAKLGERTHSEPRLNEALACFQQARLVFEAAGMTGAAGAVTQAAAWLRREPAAPATVA